MRVFTSINSAISRRSYGFLLLAFAVCLAARISAASETSQEFRGIEIRDAWARIHPTHPGEIGVYFDVVNHREQADKLRRVSSPLALRAGFARLAWDGSQPRIEQVSEISVPELALTPLTPNSWYIFLTGTSSDLAPGDLVRLSLSFANAGPVEIDVKITNQLLGNRGR